MPDEFYNKGSHIALKEPEDEAQPKPRKWSLRYADGTKFKARNVSMERTWGENAAIRMTFHVKVLQADHLPSFGDKFSGSLVTEDLCLQFEDAAVSAITRLASGGKKNRWYAVTSYLYL